MSIGVSRFQKHSPSISTMAFFVATFVFIALSAQPTAAQSRIVQKWIATLNDQAPAQNMNAPSSWPPNNLVNDATANSSGGVTVAGDTCIAVNSSGSCSNQEFLVQTYNANGQKLWASFVGSSGNRAAATSVVTGSAGDIYAAGWEQNRLQQNGNPTLSLMAAKYSPSGTREWIRYYGIYQNPAVADLIPIAIAADAQNNLYVVGFSQSAYSTFTLKFSPSGQLLWVGPLSWAHTNPPDSYPVAVAVDNSGDAYINFVNQNGAVTVKYDPSGHLLWERNPGPNPTTRQSIAVDSSGNLYEEGSGPALPSSFVRGPAMAMKFDPAGNLLWETEAPSGQCSATSYGSGGTIGLDRLGNTFVTSQNCSGEVQVTKFDMNGNVVWHSAYTGASNASPVASFVNGSGDCYVLAQAPSTNSSSNLNFLTLKYDAAGNLLWAARFSGLNSASSSEPVAMAVSGGDIFVTGSTGGPTNSPAAWATIDYVQDAAGATPTSLTFSSQMIRTTSAARAVTLKNTSTQDLDIRGINMSGPFSETNNCSSEIVAGGSCTVEIRFTPTSTGAQAGSLSISDQWAGSPDVVALTGSGVQ